MYTKLALIDLLFKVLGGYIISTAIGLSWQCNFNGAYVPTTYLHGLLVLALLCQVHRRESQVVPGQEVGAGVDEQAHVLHVAVLRRDVQRGAPVAPHAAHGVHLGAGLRQNAETPASELVSSAARNFSSHSCIQPVRDLDGCDFH